MNKFFSHWCGRNKDIITIFFDLNIIESKFSVSVVYF